MLGHAIRSVRYCCRRDLRQPGSFRFYQASKKIPDLTKERYTVQRGDFAKISDADVRFFQNLIGSSHVITDAHDTEQYNIDFLNAVRGESRLVLKPASTGEVSEIMKYCNERKLAVCPQGGNTGLVGGSVPVFDEIVVSLQYLNQVESIDEVTGILICQSGCILGNLEEEASKNGLCIPIDLGAKGSCHIGGNISTNAGGLRLLRYGNLHGSIMGVEAVLANGQILDLMSNFKKDNTGYHLKHLFIGSEGTLGIVTKLAMHCPPISKSIHVAFLGLNTFESVLNTFLAAKRDLGEILSACEMIDKASLDACTSAFNLKAPVDNYQFYMLIETSGSNSDHDEDKFNSFLIKAMEKGDVVDGTITNDVGKVRQIWLIRENVPNGIFQDGYCFKYDISLPLRRFYEIVPATAERAGDLATRVCGYGHLGDSNLHLNVSCSEYSRELHQRLEPFVYEFTSKLRGSISAEHGIGFLKTKYLKYSKTPETIVLMKQLKSMLDPNCILNPYKVLI